MVKNTLIFWYKKCAKFEPVINLQQMGMIELEGMEFYAFHGHFKSERIVGNRFEVNISIETDCEKAAKSDHLSDALNYEGIYKLIKEEMHQRSHLLENVAGRILTRIHNEYQNLGIVRVKISKAGPPMGGHIKAVSVTMER
jgi:7,8-dihydroneopterin aldolase/epimerase/oxygenase